MNRAIVIIGVVILVTGTLVPTVGLLSYSTYTSQPPVESSNIINVAIPYYLVQHYNYTRTIQANRFYSALVSSLNTNSSIVDYSTNPPTPVTPKMFANGWILGAGGSYCVNCLDYTKPAIYFLGIVVVTVGILITKKTPEEIKATQLPYWGSDNK